MKLFFLLLILLCCSINSKPIGWGHPLTQKLILLALSEPHSTDAEKEALGCFALLCHFQDKNGCKNDCKKYGEFEKHSNTISSEELSKMLLNTTSAHDLGMCTEDCNKKMKKPDSESERVCSNLCTIETSFPDIDEYMQWAVELIKSI